MQSAGSASIKIQAKKGGWIVFRKAMPGAIISIFAAPLLALAPAPQLKVTPLKGGAYVVEGGPTPVGSVNTGFVIGDTGIVVIDPQMFAFAAKAELADIAKLTSKPVNTVIVTHSDPDHIGGLPGFPRGIAIIAQENTKTEIEAALADPNPRGTPPPPELKDYLPTHLIRRSETMVLDGVRVSLMHVASGHTDGDLVVYLPAQKVVFAGDLLTMGDVANTAAGAYPVIHPNKHGSSAGWIKTVKAMLALDADQFVGGHGKAVQDRAPQQMALRAPERRRGEIQKMFESGKSLAEVKAALGETGPPTRFPTFIETTYQEFLQE